MFYYLENYLVGLLQLFPFNRYMDMEEWKIHQLEMLHGVMVEIVLWSVSLCILILGFNVPANYDDVGLNCGGLGIQKANGE